MPLKKTLLCTLIILFALTNANQSTMADKGKKAEQKQTNAKTKQTNTNNEPPLTEAERALDIILKVQNGLITNSKLKHKDMFTKAFDEDFARQSDYEANSGACKTLDGTKCSFASRIHNAAVGRTEDPDPYYYASKTTLKGKLSRRTNCRPKRDKCLIATKAGTYCMKKEKGKWKIDCFIAAWTYDPDAVVNDDMTGAYPDFYH
jgi:hypothetical protein